MSKYSKYVGLDVHKEMISIGIATTGRGEAVHYGEIMNTPEALKKLIRKLRVADQDILFCYEAGPCGYGIYRQIKGLGYGCEVIAPSLIPKKAGDRIKTDRRDAVTLARLLRAGELTPVWVPDGEQEAMRDLTRAREDMKAAERHIKQRLGAFLLRHGKIYSGKSKWTQAHFRWLEGVKFDSAIHQIVFQEYVDAVKDAKKRVAIMEKEMLDALQKWELGGVVTSLMALRGVNVVTAMTIVAELGDISRFESPRQLMAYLGLVPSEHSSGGQRHRGAITKTGNRHVRRALVESAWCYRFPARKTAILQRRAEKASKDVQEIAWKAQKRLCMRYRHLMNRGKLQVEACTAVARELAGFIWAIVCVVMNKRISSKVVAATITA
jgi:transposase